MKITARGVKRKFIIEKNEKVLAEIAYPKIFSSKANITLLKKHQIKIWSISRWTSKFAITKNDMERGDIVFNWKGQSIIRILKKSGKEKSYILKHKGWWGHRFILFDESEERILLINASLNWNNLKYNFEIECFSEKLINNEKLLIEIISYCVWGANLYMRRKANVVG